MEIIYLTLKDVVVDMYSIFGIATLFLGLMVHTWLDAICLWCVCAILCVCAHSL